MEEIVLFEYTKANEFGLTAFGKSEFDHASSRFLRLSEIPSHYLLPSEV
jgi:hypothetical protein